MTIRKDTKSFDKKIIIDSLYKKSKESDKPFYKTIAKNLEKPNRHNISINLDKIEKLNNVRNGSIVVVPGKVLADGEITKDITLYAYSFSDKVKEKISKVKTLNDLCKDSLDYKKIVILK